MLIFFFFSSRRRHTRFKCDWSSDVCSSDLNANPEGSGKESRWRFEVATNGFRYQMSSINAAIGLAQLKKADGFIARRREICRRYDAAFGEMTGLQTLRVDYREVAPHIYVVRGKRERRGAGERIFQNVRMQSGE